jgi:hypothetical protein
VSSEYAIASLRFFYCGRGDTILVGAGGRWGLVDCNLTEVSGADQRLRQFIRSNGIKRLDVACLSHPDQDHYSGLQELLQECFCDDTGSTVKWNFAEFWDSGADFGLLLAIADRLGSNSARAGIRSLYGFLQWLILNGNVTHFALGPSSELPLDFGEFYFVSLSPVRNRIDRFNSQTAEAILQLEGLEFGRCVETSNNLSAILVFMHKTLPVDIILGSDATAEVWREALEVWKTYSRRRSRSGRFDCVKVSHHGAKGSLHEDLYQDFCQARKTIAILSVGQNHSQQHPHPDVLKAFKRNGIRAYATCWRTRRLRRPKRRLPLPKSRHAHGGPQAPNPKLRGHDWADIEVRVMEDGRLKVEPSGSRLRLRQL